MPITNGQKLFFIVICAAALLVAALGLFAPQYLAAIFTWLTLPPLHARFVGAIYLFGAVYMAGCLLARNQAEVRPAFPMIGIWTGMLFIISLLHLEAFDFSQLPVWIWFASYLVYPIIAVRMTLKYSRRNPSDDLQERTLPGWAGGYLLGQGVIVTLLGVMLFIFPGLMSSLWPWKVTPLLAQMYAGPLLSYGVGSLLYARQHWWSEIRPVVPAMLAFTLTTLVISTMHRNLFSAGELTDWVWFVLFGAGSVGLAALTSGVLRRGE
ncbi:MAG: hypothetical protein A2Z16_07075 [Chloroflexi bacterium RBG_16_54_18]|nr:MAG: hypothetical protein A2Z16_07075 [Chloroflexi bacterium RBG_16_54_18]